MRNKEQRITGTNSLLVRIGILLAILLVFILGAVYSYFTGFYIRTYRENRFYFNQVSLENVQKSVEDQLREISGRMDRFFEENGFTTLNILHNNCYEYEGIGICGSRGWINETGKPEDDKVINREAIRLEASILCAEKQGLRPVVFLHYPPVFSGSVNKPIFDVLKSHGIKLCFYGHLHGRAAHTNAVTGQYEGVELRLISADHLQFDPLDITDIVQCDEF